MKQLVLIAGPLHGKAGLDAAICLKEDIGRCWPQAQVELVNTASNERNLHEMKKMLVSEKLYPKAKMDELCVAVLSFCLLPGVEYERVRRWASSLALEFAVYGNPSIRILDDSEHPLDEMGVEQQSQWGKERACPPDCHVELRSVWMAPPLLGTPEGIQALSQVLETEYPAKTGESLVLVGHGSCYANGVYRELERAFHRAGRRDVFVGTLRDGSGGIQEMIKRSGIRAVRLVPLMLAAGIHTVRDMAGTQSTSWKSQLEQAEFEVYPVVRGLAELTSVRNLFLRQLARFMKE